MIYTSFFASKNPLRCLICQNPMAKRIPVCMSDHHSTRWFVLSLVILNLSSRTWKFKMLTVIQIPRAREALNQTSTFTFQKIETNSYPLIILFLWDLFNLIKQLTHPELNLSQFLLAGNIAVVDGMLADPDIQMDFLRDKLSFKTKFVSILVWQEVCTVIKLTSCEPLNQLVELEWRQMMCSPGVCDVNVKRPSELYWRDIITFSSGSLISTCMPMPGLDGIKPPDCGSWSCNL